MQETQPPPAPEYPARVTARAQCALTTILEELAAIIKNDVKIRHTLAPKREFTVEWKPKAEPPVITILRAGGFAGDTEQCRCYLHTEG